MTAIAVVSAMRIRTAPPFVGRPGAPGSARWGRAPAIAYAPRTESGKASSVLAWCRRVCGRMCESPGVVLGVSSLRRIQASPWWTGAPRLRQVYGCSTTTTFRKDLSRRLHHLPESVLLFCDGDPSSRVLRSRHPGKRSTLSWGDIPKVCELLHNEGSENGLFASMKVRNNHDNYLKAVNNLLTCIFIVGSGETGHCIREDSRGAKVL
jgi:hypothetical protein